MSKHELDILHGVVIESDEPLTLEELAHALQLHNEMIEQMVEYQLIEPEGESPDEWRFDALCLRRARIASNLNRDLEINFAGISLVLELLERIEALEQELHTK